MSDIKQLPSFEDVASLFAKSSIYKHPSFAHGYWLGMICGGVHASPKAWLETVLEKEENWASLPTSLQHMILLTAEASVEQLGDTQYSLQLLIPDDEEELDDRVHAVTEWCRGFMEAFRNHNQKHSDLLQGDAAEALSDLNEITQMGLELEDDPEEEQNYAELMEYVRVAVILIHQDLLSRQSQPSGNTTVLH